MAAWFIFTAAQRTTASTPAINAYPTEGPFSQRFYQDNLIEPRSLLHQHFDHIYVLYVPERLHRMRMLVSAMGVRATFAQVEPLSECGIERLRERGIVEPDVTPDLIATKRSCFVSHTTILKHFLNSTSSDSSRCLVFEDDIIPGRGLWEKRLESALTSLNRLPQGAWTYFNLGRCWEYCDGFSAPYVGADLIRTNYTQCTHAFAVTRAGAEEISQMKMNLSFDNALRKHIHREGRGYAAATSVFVQDRANIRSLLGSFDAASRLL